MLGSLVHPHLLSAPIRFLVIESDGKSMEQSGNVRLWYVLCFLCLALQIIYSISDVTYRILRPKAAREPAALHWQRNLMKLALDRVTRPSLPLNVTMQR